MIVYQQDGKIRIHLNHLTLIEYMTIPDLDACWRYVTPNIAFKKYDAGKIAAIRTGGPAGAWHILKEMP